MKRNTIHVSGCCLIAAALTLLASCTPPDDVFGQVGGDMHKISFRINASEGPSASRGAMASTSNFKDIFSAIKVSAYLDGTISTPLKQNATDQDAATATAFENISFSYWKNISGNECWETDATGFYWWQEYKLRFFAYAPASVGLSSTNYDDDGNIEFDYTVPSGITIDSKCADAVSQPDVLVTSSPLVKRTSLSAITDPDDASVTYYRSWLYFYHALCAVNFKIGTVSEGATIDKIVLHNLASQGTCTFTRPTADAVTGYSAVYSADQIAWTLASGHEKDGSYSQAFGTQIVASAQRDLTSGRISTGDMVYGADTDKNFILLPQDNFPNPATANKTTDPYIEIYVSIAGEELPLRTAKLKGDQIGTNKWGWLPGKYYTYTISGTFETDNGLLLTLSVADWTLSSSEDVALE